MRNTTVIGRTAAVAAVALAIIAVAVIVLSGGSSYQVHALFQNASQIVAGDQVQVAGNSVGSVSGISLTKNGLADLTLTIDSGNFTPLHEGTQATVRLTSLSGIANRYVELRLGPATAPQIPNNGTIQSTNTTSAVDLDELLNTLNAPTRKGIQDVFQGSASQYDGQGQKIRAAWQYLNPAIAASSVLFAELNRDTSKFRRFIVKGGSLVTDLAQRAGALSGLVQNLSTTTSALAAQHQNLAASLQKLPGFMRLANTTFVNLRAALDDLTPLVDVSKPVAPKLRAFLEQLKPLAEQSVPTVRDLSLAIRRPGPNNDLIELTGLQPGLAAVAVRSLYINGKLRPGAFPISTTALNESTPELSVARPYAVDLTGWFEGFTHPGTIDANGGTSRVASNNFSASLGVVAPSLAALLTKVLPTLPLPQQLTTFVNNINSFGLTAYQGDRCPGSMERGALWYPESGYPCNPKEVPTGP